MHKCQQNSISPSKIVKKKKKLKKKKTTTYDVAQSGGGVNPVNGIQTSSDNYFSEDNTDVNKQ